MVDVAMGKERFLAEHNRLSPANLQATLALLTRFQEEQKPLLKDVEWSFKLRPQVISWMLMLPLLPLSKKRYTKKSTELIFKSYPGSDAM